MHQKTVLITGCSSGIGRATALDFLDEEWEVYATARNPADIETLGERGANIATLDVTDQGDVDRVVDRIVDEQGRIDCLVNNAGYGQMGPVEDVPTGKVHDQFDVNVYGPHRLVRAALPHMRSQGDGTIVNVSSVVGRVAFPGTGVYAGSKFALEAMTDALRTEVEEYGVDAVLIEPGPVETRFSNRVEAEVNGDGDEADGLDRSGAYEKLYKLFDDSQALGGGGPGAIPPERVAEDIVNAASSTKPRARYQPGTVARIGVLARFLPDAWRDALYGFARKLP
ncbi:MULTISPECIES: SDR family oxidoreductase [unclassified Haloferax]|uniref:SDR family oxidoreductase n=1 Tax=Haloferax TaxID=2251 RepID=UPI0002B222C8|nr:MULTISPECIES: SDR family oxidoreductase [unclassified Haloferax]ELZ58725.1 oxidoreductase [Haloferax sp. ATCC BAA-646]ELZ62719.1 oxidoreductase [Haloferax sp. ATCC BAA-644]ELZ63755.1 oxidoreductase [Haloferax sp. ATCC BAA-645]